MKKNPNLVFNIYFTLDLTNKISIGNIPKNILYDRLNDGRILGLLVEDIISYEFNGITRVLSNGCSHDLIKSDVDTPLRLQCKIMLSTKDINNMLTLTKNSAYIKVVDIDNFLMV